MNLLTNNKEILFKSICDDNTSSLSEDVISNFKKVINSFEEAVKKETDLRRFLNYKISITGDSLLIVEWFFRDAVLGFVIEKDFYKSSWFLKGNHATEQTGHISTLRMESLLILLKASGVF